MPRYIDANLAKEALTGWETDPTDEEISFTIDNIPTADVAPMVEFERLQIEIQALKIANEKMYVANKESKAEVAKEIIGIIEQRNESNNEHACGVKSEIFSALYRGKEDAYRDIKEILEQKYTGGGCDD